MSGSVRGERRWARVHVAAWEEVSHPSCLRVPSPKDQTSPICGASMAWVAWLCAARPEEGHLRDDEGVAQADTDGHHPRRALSEGSV